MSSYAASALMICAPGAMWAPRAWARFSSACFRRATLAAFTGAMGPRPPDAQHLSLAEQLQLPCLGKRRAHLQCRDMDAAHGAQDWIVLTQLTHNNATAVGVVMGFQFGPQLLLLPVTGFAADHFDRRKLLLATQAAMGLLALGLGLLTVAGLVQLWHVYAFAFLLGCVTAFDSP